MHALAVVAILFVGLVQAPEPSVGRTSLKVETVRRGDIVRMVRGLGELTAKRTAELKLPALQARDVQAGQKAVIDTRFGTFAGSVVRIAPAGSGETSVEVQLESDPPAQAEPGAAVDGAIHLVTLKDVVYVSRPATGTSESAGTLFRLDATGRYAARVNVEFGLTALTTSAGAPAEPVVEVRAGLKAGDQVILSDMSAFKSSERVRVEP